MRNFFEIARWQWTSISTFAQASAAALALSIAMLTSQSFYFFNATNQTLAAISEDTSVISTHSSDIDFHITNVADYQHLISNNVSAINDTQYNILHDFANSILILNNISSINHHILTDIPALSLNTTSVLDKILEKNDEILSQQLEKLDSVLSKLDDLISEFTTEAFDKKVYSALAKATFTTKGFYRSVDVFLDACIYDPAGAGPINCDRSEFTDFRSVDVTIIRTDDP